MAITAIQSSLDFAGDLLFDVELGNLDNIKAQLPKLFPTQQEDVWKIETCYLEKKGYMITNGTGTGKTYVGLGVISRFLAQGKNSILIVVPTDKKCKDWIEEGQGLSIYVRQLTGVTDSYGSVIVTTYANFYQNEALILKHFDLVVYDECHYLNQNAQGTQTSYLETHHKVVRNPQYANTLARGQMEPYPNIEDFGDDPQSRRVYRKLCEDWEERWDKLAWDIHLNTKVLFLSATPFAYHKSIKYADGCLWYFSMKPGKDDTERSTRYNEATGFEKFLCERLGYRMKYNKCTIPESGVDIDFLERKLFEDSVKEGVMSTRQLFLKFDYSREFIRMESDIGYKIDKGIELIKSHEFSQRYKLIHKFAKVHFNYLFINQILEMIKVRGVIPRIKKHLALNRKVVIYHSYNHGYISHPFRFSVESLLKHNKDADFLEGRMGQEIIDFSREYSEYWGMELDDLKNVRETIKKHFPDRSLEFNGTVAKGKRQKHVESFMTDYSDHDIIVVQVKAGKEGISFHDTTGEHQRVLITLGLPTAPTDAIQIEGRIYREGVKSNAIYEYITLQTSFEGVAFADKIATRSRTAENLAMGNLARDLENSFREGYQNWNENDPHVKQGFGGVEDDKDLQEGSDFEKACTFYYMQKKRTAKDKSAEGVDYFATPEPLGYKMVEWLGLAAGDSFLEPSAGHGAIGRWVDSLTENKFLEPSYQLFGKLGLNVTGECLQTRFEDFHIMNKFDGIAMNPPYGHMSKTAAEHVMKACIHLKDWGTVTAIVPAGESFKKAFKKLKDETPIGKLLFVTAVVKLPSCTFKRAGTNVSTIVLKIKRVPRMFNFEYDKSKVDIHDLTWCPNVEVLFSQLETLELKYDRK